MASMYRRCVLSVFGLVSVLMMSCQPTPSSTSPNLTPAPVSVQWQIISNLDVPGHFTSELTLTNKNTAPLSNSGWTLYFNSIRPIDTSQTPESVSMTHINGDFFKLEPTNAFPTLAPEESITIPMVTLFWAIKKSDAPVGFYMVYTDEAGNDLPPEPVEDYTIGEFSTPAHTMRQPGDEVPVPTPASTYKENAALSLLPAEDLAPVIPSPASWEVGEGTVEINSDTQIKYDEPLESEAGFLADALTLYTGKALSLDESEEQGAGMISLQLDNTLRGDAAYTLEATPDNGILIKGSDQAGVFYGIQSLRGLLPPNPEQTATVPAIQITDQPRFGYRGMHLDVARNFHTKASVLKLLDAMAFYKLNKFHFHFSDDEGWRLEIAELPELTDVGGQRGHTITEEDHLYPSLGSGPDPHQSNGSGYFSREDFIEILQYAHRRHIEVIPEFDLPGHARAAIVSMKARHNAGKTQPDYRLTHPDDTSKYQSVQLFNDNVVDVCLPSTYDFIEHVIDDIAAMYKEAMVPFKTLHMGNDEVPHGVWEGSPACQALDTPNYNSHFLHKMSDILNSHNLTLAGWEEIALANQIVEGHGGKVPNPEFVDKNFQPYVWNAVWGWGSEGLAYSLANAGYNVVISNATNLYFDFAYDKDPEEPGYYWAGFTNTQKAFVFNPFNLYQNASYSLMGQPINPDKAYGNFPQLTKEGRNNILGIQGQLWSESAKGSDLLEYLIFPKLLGLAERAWAAEPNWVHTKDLNTRRQQEQAGWNAFANKLGQQELERLDRLFDINFRVPPPGAQVMDGTVLANAAFPGLEIRYTTENREPQISDPVYSSPIPFNKGIRLKAFSATGRQSRSIQLGTF